MELATSQFNYRTLLDTRPPQSFTHQGAIDQTVATGTADTSYIRVITPKSWSGLGSQNMLSTRRQARMTVQFHHNGAPSTSLTVWIYFVLDETMRCPIRLGWDSWVCFHSCSYQTLSSTPDGRVLVKLILVPIYDNNPGGTSANIRNYNDPTLPIACP